MQDPEYHKIWLAQLAELGLPAEEEVKPPAPAPVTIATVKVVEAPAPAEPALQRRQGRQGRGAGHACGRAGGGGAAEQGPAETQPARCRGSSAGCRGGRRCRRAGQEGRIGSRRAARGPASRGRRAVAAAGRPAAEKPEKPEDEPAAVESGTSAEPVEAVPEEPVRVVAVLVEERQPPAALEAPPREEAFCRGRSARKERSNRKRFCRPGAPDDAAAVEVEAASRKPSWSHGRRRSRRR